MKHCITDIQVQKKHPSRRSIFLDGEFYCGVAADTAARFSLRPGMEIDENELKDMLHEEDFSEAKNYVYRILARRMYTNKEIRDKLSERGYTAEIIQDVIAAMERYGYLNDKTFAEEWIRSRMQTKPKGKIALRQELARKGIERSIIEDALSRIFGDSKELDTALDLARRRVKSYSKDEPETARRKLWSFLLRRGFDFETVKDVVERVVGDM